jgi:hypothetical protein
VAVTSIWLDSLRQLNPILLDLPSQPPLEQLRAIRFQREPLKTQNPDSLTQKVG